MANMQKFPIADLQYGEATNAGLYTVCKAIHPNGYMAVQLPPCTLAFDAVDPNSRFAPKLKLKISNSEQIAWLRAMDKKAKAAVADKLEKYPFKATVNEGSYGCQIEVKPLGSIKVFVINAEGRKKRGTLADLKRGATVSVKATGFGSCCTRTTAAAARYASMPRRSGCCQKTPATRRTRRSASSRQRARSNAPRS